MDHEVHEDDKESEANQDRWEPLENKVPQDSVALQAPWAQQDYQEQMEVLENQEILAKMDKKEKGDLMVLLERMV